MSAYSTNQAMDVLCDIFSAYLGKHGFGGRTAEIYVYRLMPHSPSWAHAPNCEIAREAHEKLIHDANAALWELLGFFRGRFVDAEITVDGRKFTRRKKPPMQSHRWTVEVTRRGEAAL